MVDLRLTFGTARTEKRLDTCIIIIEVAIDADHIVLGALADSVAEVIALDAGQIGPSPRIGTAFISARGNRDDRFMIRLDVGRVSSNTDLRSVVAREPQHLAA